VILKKNAPDIGSFLLCVLPSMMMMLWVVTVVVTLAHELQHEYLRRCQLRDNEEWLRIQCATDEFYHNMREHSTLCDEVFQRANASALLDATAHVLQNSHFCGPSSCSSLAYQFGQYLHDRILSIGVIGVILMMVALVVVRPWWKMYKVRLAEESLQERFNAPYGLHNYIHAHPYVATTTKFHPN